MILLLDDIFCGFVFCRIGIGILFDLEVMFFIIVCNKLNNCIFIR